MQKTCEQIMAEVGAVMGSLHAKPGHRVEILGFQTIIPAYGNACEMNLSVNLATLEGLAQISEILKQDKSVFPKISLNGELSCGISARLLKFHLLDGNGYMVVPGGTSGLFTQDEDSPDLAIISESFAKSIGRDPEDNAFTAARTDGLSVKVSSSSLSITGYEKYTKNEYCVHIYAQDLPELLSRARAAVSPDEEESSSPSM